VSQRSSPSVWFADPPSHWGAAKLKHLASFQSGDGITAHSIDDEGEYPVYGGNGLRGYTSSYTHDGDYILVGRQGALCGNVNYASGKFWASEHAIVVTPRLNVCLRWLGELLLAMNLGQYSQSAAQPGLSVEYIVNLPVPVPPLAEQRAIAAFLDRKTAEIDAVIARKERLIALLQEERQALISRAVTRGLDAGAAVKDSGIPWLGEVPKHWHIVQLKFLAQIQTGITLGKVYDEPTKTYPYLRVANVQDGSFQLDEITEISVPANEAARSRLQTGDVLMTEGGDLDKLGRGSVWKGQIANCLHQNHVFAVRPVADRLMPEFLAYLTKASHGREYFTLTGQRTTNLASTNTTKVGAFPIPLPPLAEQQEICSYVDRATSRIDGVVRMNNDQITKLREYRQALISAAVTGKFALPQEVSS
jgi:type I restriction enzyme S subunit